MRRLRQKCGLFASKVLPKLFMVFTLLLCGCTDHKEPEAVDQSVRPARVMVVAMSSKPQSIELIGRVEAAQSIDLSFEVSGPLHELPVREGETVTKGSLLAALDKSDFTLDVQESAVQLRLAQQDLDRKQRVLAQKGIARSAVDDARSMRDLQRVRLSQARQKLADATLLAPFTGVVAERFVDGFANVNAGQPILRLHAGNELQVVANVPERLAATLTPEDIERIYCRFSFSGQEEFPLTFKERRGEADRVAQSTEVSFTLARSAEWNLMPGMTATVNIELKDSSQSSVVIPATAVVADAQRKLFVWLIGPDGQSVSQRYVQISESLAEGLAVTDGLENGDVIVTTGATGLSQGMKVRPLAESERI